MGLDNTITIGRALTYLELVRWIGHHFSPIQIDNVTFMSRVNPHTSEVARSFIYKASWKQIKHWWGIISISVMRNILEI